MLKRIIVLAGMLASAAAAAEPVSPVTVKYSEPLRLIEEPARLAINGAPDSRRLQFDAFGKRFDVALTPNRSLSLERQNGGSAFVAWKGKLEGIDNSWARISFIDGAPQGMISDGEQLYAIEKHGGADTPIVFRVEDLEFAEGALACPVHKTTHTAAELIGDLNRTLEVQQPPVGRALGATRQIDIGVVADTSFTDLAANNADPQGAVLARMNTVDGIYSDQLQLQFNVAQLEILTGPNDPFTDQTDAGDLLDEVAVFRASTPQREGQGLTHLFTGRNLDGSTAGIAFLDVVCFQFRGTGGRNFGVGLTQSTFGAATDAIIAAHEFGHNFSAEHDGEDGSVCVSEPETFLMAPRVASNTTFSPCTLNLVQNAAAAASCIRTLSVAEISISAQPDPLGVLADTPVTTAFTVLNEGTEPVTNIVVDIPIPSDLVLQSVSSTDGDCTSSATAAQCTLNVLASTVSFDVTIQVQASTGGVRDIAATVSSTEDTNAGNNSATSRVVFEAAVDIDVNGGSATATTTTTADVPVQVNNLSDDVADDVVVVLTPDSGLTIESASWSGVGSCVLDMGVATCTAQTVGASAQTTIDLDVTSGQTGSRSIAAEATTSTTDINTANNTSAATVTINTAAAPPPPNNGGGGGGGGAVTWLLALFAGLLVRRRRV
ncbi:MAG: M12 family metallo-peptidase [Pseudomonadota bacterium]